MQNFTLFCVSPSLASKRRERTAISNLLPLDIQSISGAKRCIAISLVLIGCCLLCHGQTVTISVSPSADAFVSSLGPSNNFGGAGAITVSGLAAVNELGEQNGLYDSLLRFPMSNFVASADAALGTHQWLITRATLHAYEMGAPPNPVFNRG